MKINYKVTENMLHSGCVNKADFSNLTNKFNNLTDKYRVVEDKLIEVFNENNDLCENNQFLRKENEILRKQLEDLKIIVNKDNKINDELLYIDPDLFVDTYYDLKEKNRYYEKYLDILDDIFDDNNINSLSELKTILSNSFYKNRYNNIFTILENSEIKIKSQNLKMIDLSNKYKNLDVRINIIKNKIQKLPIGHVVTIKGVKKIFRGKNEKCNIFKMIEEEFNNYCNDQIIWAKSIIGNNIISDKEIITLLDVYNKLTKKYSSGCSSDDEISNIFNKIESNKLNDYILLSELGKQFIKNDITDKSQIQDIIKNYKKVIYCYDSKDKINRFISTCKRLYALSQKIKVDNIMKSKCQTRIRDMTNTEFDNLLKLIENLN